MPHRAVYEITLADKRQAVSVASVKGRMVFEITGSSCEGYTQNMRMLTRITDEKGKRTLSDVRSSTWERGDGGRFRFTSSQYFDSVLQEMVSGLAVRHMGRRKKPAITVKIRKPAAGTLDIPGDVLFPTQHSLAILQAARENRARLDVRVYDGSEQGQGLYRTFGFIGRKILPGREVATKEGEQKRKDVGVKLARLGLAGMVSWPVAISYFDGKEGGGDPVPSYELSFRLYQNGVSRNLLINFGDFSVRGVLDRISYLGSSPCKPGSRRK